MKTTDVQGRDSTGCDAGRHGGPVDFSISVSIGNVAGTALAGTVLLDDELEDATLDDLQRAAEAIVQAATDALGQAVSAPVVRPGEAEFDIESLARRSPPTGGPPTSAASEPEFDVEALARNLAARDLAANFEVLGAYLDRLLPRWSQKVPRERLAPFEHALTELAAEEGSHCARGMSAAVADRRELRRAAMNRYECQVHCERLLLRLHDLLDSTTSERAPTMITLLNEIERDPTAYLTVSKAAAYLALSDSHFARQFKQFTRENYIRYITNKRIERAKFLLVHTDTPVMRIGTDLDFHPVNYFSRTFKKYTGLTPSQYRTEWTRGDASSADASGAHIGRHDSTTVLTAEVKHALTGSLP